MSGAASFVSDVVGGVVDVVKDVGSFIDDKVIQPIVKDPVSAVATVVGAVYGGPLVAAQLGTSAAASAAIAAGAANTAAGLAQGESPEEAIQGGLLASGATYLGSQFSTGAEGLGPVADVGAAPGVEVFPVAPPAPVTITPIEPSGLLSSAAGNLLGGPAELASVAETMAPAPSPSNVFEYGYQPVMEVPPAPVIEATPVSTNPTRFPAVEVQPTYTPTPGSFQDVLPSLGVETQATTAPYTALAGTFPAAVAATTGGLLSTAAAPTTLSIQDALRGARLINSLMQQPQQQMPQDNLPTVPRGNIDYSQLLGLLSQRANATGLLGTRFQPQPINLASLLG